MCLSSGSPAMPPPPPPPVAPPPPPPKITVAPAPTVALPEPFKNEQAKADSPIRKRRGTSARGKSMLKIPMNTPALGKGGSSMNISSGL